MPYGTLPNLAKTGFVRTPTVCAEAIVHHLLRFGPHATVIDPTAGEGDLLAPCLSIPGTRLLGVEISAERADVARQILPSATIITHPIEAMAIPAYSFDVALCNPPYFFIRADTNEQTQRAEYRIIADIGPVLRPGGIMVAIIPARSAWTTPMINHWAKHYQNIRCWKFPDATSGTASEEDFDRYTQIVVIGVRRETPLAAPDPLEKQRLSGWQWRRPTGWAQGTPPPDLPAFPIATPYLVPSGLPTLPEVRMRRADDAQLVQVMHQATLPATWKTATQWHADTTVALSIMPPTGEAHLAADILTGLLDGEHITGPDGTSYVFTTFVTKELVTIPVDHEEREKLRQRGVISIRVQEQRDRMVLGALCLETGELQFLQGAAASAFLAPWLPTLAQQALVRRQPRYRLTPAPWELEVGARIGCDKQLPGAPHPGLVAPQLHRVFALAHALDDTRRAAIQGEPGTGKTRIATAIAARQAHLWHHAEELRTQGQPTPRWVKRLQQAWRQNPRTRQLLATSGTTRPALPVLVCTPKRVQRTWLGEIHAAYPAAEVMVIRDHTDIPRWFARCAQTTAPVVFGIFAHSTTRAFGRMWQPAVIERTHQGLGPDLEPDDPNQEMVAVKNVDGKLLYYQQPDGTPLVKLHTRTEFFCPTCGTHIHAIPHDKKAAEADAQEVVTSRTWFEQKQRSCDVCHTPLWTETRVPVVAQKYPQLTYAQWSTAVTVPAAAGTFRSRTEARIVDAHGMRGPVAPDSFSPYTYLKQCYRGCVALSIIDESHNGRGQATDIGQAMHEAQLAAQTHLYASGTHYGGCLDDFFAYWFRFHPQFWRQLGYRWKDAEKAIPVYGVIQQRITERESEARRGSGRTDITMSTVTAPGLSARLIPHLLAELAFLTVLDVGSYMPPRIEIPVIVSLRDEELVAHRAAACQAEYEARQIITSAQQLLATAEDEEHAGPDDGTRGAAHALLAEGERKLAVAQAATVWGEERDLEAEYHRITTHLEELAKNLNAAATLAQGTVPRWFAALPCDEPFIVTSTTRGDWGDVEQTQEILRTKRLAWDHCYPLEHRLRTIVAQEREQGRRVMVYVEQSQKRDMARRLAYVLNEYQPWILPHSVKPEDREEAIRQAVAAGHGVVIVGYRLVSEGLNLQDCIDSIVWYELAMNLFLLDQASRRCWRLGKREEVRIYYLVYALTAGHKKLRKLGGQSGAAAAFAGEPAQGALVEQGGGNQTALAQLSQGIYDARALAEENDRLQAAFAQRADELHATLQHGRQWIGIEDHLEEQLITLHHAIAAANAARVLSIPAAPQLDDPTTTATAQVLVPPAQPELVSVATTEPGRASMQRAWDDPELRALMRKRRAPHKTATAVPQAASLVPASPHAVMVPPTTEVLPVGTALRPVEGIPISPTTEVLPQVPASPHAEEIPQAMEAVSLVSEPSQAQAIPQPEEIPSISTTDVVPAPPPPTEAVSIAESPYTFASSTIHIRLMLLPDDLDPAGRRVVVALREEDGDLLVQELRLQELGTLPPSITTLLTQLEAEMPARASVAHQRAAARPTLATTPPTKATKPPTVKAAKTTKPTPAVPFIPSSLPPMTVSPHVVQTSLFSH